MVLTLKSVDEILKFYQSYKGYWAAVLSCGTVYYAVQDGSNFWVWIKYSSVTIQRNATEEFYRDIYSQTQDHDWIQVGSLWAPYQSQTPQTKTFPSFCGLHSVTQGEPESHSET